MGDCLMRCVNIQTEYYEGEVPKDLLGQALQPGDIIAYPTTSSRSAMNNIYKILSIQASKATTYQQGQELHRLYLKAQALVSNQWFKGVEQSSTITFPGRAIKLPFEYEQLAREAYERNCNELD